MKYFIVLVIVMISNTFLGVAKPMKNQAEIYFAGGCFWGTEHFLKQIRGVENTQVGYANSNCIFFICSTFCFCSSVY
jgi:peptide methionine sulfoxide reductase msrA/msrB